MSSKNVFAEKKYPVPYSYRAVRYFASMSYAYQHMFAYPTFGFAHLRSDREGSMPTTLPIVHNVTEYLNSAVFGQHPDFRFDDPVLEKALGPEFRYSLAPRLKRIRGIGGIHGTVLIRFTLDTNPNSSKPIKYHVLDSRQFYAIYNPTDNTDLEMVVLQWPYVGLDGTYYWHREELHKDHIKLYEPRAIKGAGDGANLYAIPGLPFQYNSIVESAFLLGVTGDLEDWKYESIPNLVGEIPAVVIRNKDYEDGIGTGDFFKWHGVLKRLDATYYLMDLSNQKEAFVDKVFVNVEAPEDLVPSAPGEEIYVESKIGDNGDTLPADVKLLEATGSMRTHMAKFTDDLRQMLYEGTGSVFNRAADVSNKGNLTSSVLSTMQAPTQGVLEEYRDNYGTFGFALLQIKIARAMIKTGLLTGVSQEFGKTYAVDNEMTRTAWSDTVNLDAQEKLLSVERLMREGAAGLISKLVAVRKIDALEGIKATEEELKEQVKTVDFTAGKENGTTNPGTAKPRVKNKDAGTGVNNPSGRLK